MKKTLSIAAIALLALGAGLGIRAEDDHKHDEKKHKHDEAEKKDEHGHKHDEHDHAKDEHKHEGHDHDHGHADEVKLTADAIRKHDIRVAKVVKQKLAASFTAPARVTFNAEAMAHVGSLVSGRAAEIKVKLGDEVKKGDELIVVESPQLGEAQSDYLQKRTAVSVAESAVAPAKQALDRANKLYEKNQGIALAEVQKRESDHQSAVGAVQSAQASLEAAANTLLLMGFDEAGVELLGKTRQINARYVIRAPIAGQVIERETTLGELVSPDKDALVVIADLKTLWAIADVPEARLASVQVGSTAKVKTISNPFAVAGKVTYVAPSLNASTRTAQVRIELPNADGVLRPGMFGRAHVADAANASGEAVLAIPQEAIQTVEGKPCVFVPLEGEENTFAPRPIETGHATGGMVTIESGVNEGDSIVVNGAFILKADLGKAGAAHEH